MFASKRLLSTWFEASTHFQFNVLFENPVAAGVDFTGIVFHNRGQTEETWVL
ncbi:MAG TPA: hypothetical protein VEW46_13285 [Pyrinomonadaceae bacterium]|nr:hypothetical protein [Pyrinomonadaceae bacterium]